MATIQNEIAARAAAWSDADHAAFGGVHTRNYWTCGALAIAGGACAGGGLFARQLAPGPAREENDAIETALCAALLACDPRVRLSATASTVLFAAPSAWLTPDDPQLAATLAGRRRQMQAAGIGCHNAPHARALRSALFGVRRRNRGRGLNATQRLQVLEIAMQYLLHVTLDTGDARRSPRTEITPNALALIAPVIAAAQNGPAEIPVMPGYTIEIAASGRDAMLATVRLDGARGPVLRFGCARTSRAGAPLWRRLHDDSPTRAPARTDPDEPPPAPWLGVRLETGALDAAPAHLAMLADLERVVAWAWLEGA